MAQPKLRTEVDLVRQVMKKRIHQQACDIMLRKGSINQKELTSQIAKALLLWQELSKQIVEEIDNGNTIDTVYFGCFGKVNDYFYCPNNKSKLLANDYNLTELPSANKEALIQVNYNKIAKKCEMTSDAVLSILAALRDEISDFSIIRKNTLLLTFAFGVLTIKSGVAEFKPAENKANCKVEYLDAIPYSKEFDEETNANQGSKAVSVVERSHSCAPAKRLIISPKFQGKACNAYQDTVDIWKKRTGSSHQTLDPVQQFKFNELDAYLKLPTSKDLRSRYTTNMSVGLSKLKTNLCFLNTRSTHTNNLDRQTTQDHKLFQSFNTIDVDMTKTISKALDRKRMSSQYHTQMPVFMRSEGPYSIYDHSLKQGGPPDQPTHTDQVADLALRRYEHELQKLKDVREHEKKTFFETINIANSKAQAHETGILRNNYSNKLQVVSQINQQREKSQQDMINSKTYFKPHFGPEETHSKLVSDNLTQKYKVEWQHRAIKDQLDEQAAAAREAKEESQLLEKARLKEIAFVQQQEDNQRRLKDFESRRNLQQAWTEQIAYKAKFKQVDKLFH